MMGVQDLRYEKPTPIQEECIPLILEGRDVIGAAQTGTGKTGAFVIPLLQKIITDKTGKTQALILSPTRELAQQIEEQIFALGYHTGVSSATVTGGSDYGTQVKAIRAGVDIIVATPGRLIDQMNVLDLDFSHLNYLVLDEADRMLDMGFLPDVMKIVKQLPSQRQTMLFSATMGKEVQDVVNQVMRNPEKVEFEISKPVDSVDQQIYFVEPNKKLWLFEQLFDEKKYKTALVFTATKRGTDELEKMLKKRNIDVVSMHGDRDQEERNEALRLFKNKSHPVMVATDVLSRGIDIDDVSLIVNYDVPNNPEDYIHRIGRTGRYDKTGTAITFVSNKDKKYYYAIKNVVGDQLSIKDLPEETEKKQQKQSESQTQAKSSDGRQKKSREAQSNRDQKKSAQKKDTRKQRPSSGDQQKGNKRPTAKKSTNGSENQESQEQKKKSQNKRQPKPQKDSSNGNSGNDSRSSGRSGKRIPTSHLRDFEEDIFQPEIIEKAVSRNRNSLKPAKGIWGIIKSFIPKIGS
jgi:superfamily II DNA/RNA helicase